MSALPSVTMASACSAVVIMPTVRTTMHAAGERSAPFVVALIGQRREPTVQKIAVSEVQLDGVEADAQSALCRIGESRARPWEGGKALSEAEDPWPTIGPSALPFGPGWHTPRLATEADMARVRLGVRISAVAPPEETSM